MSYAEDRLTIVHALDKIVSDARSDVRKQMIGNGVIGWCWLAGDPGRTEGLTNAPAKALFEFLPVYPMRAWGVLLLTPVVVALGAYLTTHVGVLRWALLLMAAYWVFWAVLYGIAYFNGDGAGVGITFAVLWAMRNRTVAKACHQIVRREP